jgi:hypothetical protein
MSFAIVPRHFGRLLWRKLDVIETHGISAAVGVTPNHRELEGIVAGRREGHVAKIKLLENAIAVSAVFVFRRSNVGTLTENWKIPRVVISFVPTLIS